MSRIAYVNGRYRPLAEASVSVEDRGFQFADGVYEVCEVREGRLVDESRHLARLERSLDKLAMVSPMAMRPLRIIMREVVRRNRIRNGLLYMQITRGAAPRAHAFPPPDTPPTIVVTARPSTVTSAAKDGISVITVPETRWARVDIKTVSLLPNALAKQAAIEAGAQEAWFVGRDGLVNEGASSNAWIVRDGAVVTAPASAQILEGITRAVVIETAQQLGLELKEQRFSVADALSADEAFVTSATANVTPVTRIDGKTIGSGAPGKVALTLRHALLEATRPEPDALQ